MNMLKRRKINKSNGFTIVELLVVIVIIGVLAGISLAVYSGVQKRATFGDAAVRLWQLLQQCYAHADSTNDDVLAATNRQLSRIFRFKNRI